MSGAGAFVPARRAGRGRLSELRLRAGAHQRTRRPLFADSRRFASGLFGPDGRLRTGADSGQHDRAGRGAARRRFGAVRFVGHRRHDQRHHQGTFAQFGAIGAYADLARRQQLLRQQHDAQCVARDRERPCGALRLRSEPPPFGVRPRRRRIYRAAPDQQPVGRHAVVLPHGRLFAHHGAVPPHRRIPPRRRPAGPAAPRGDGGRADRPLDRRRKPFVRHLVGRPPQPFQRLCVVPEYGPQELLRQQAGPRRIRYDARPYGRGGRAVRPCVPETAFHARRTHARQRIQLRRPERPFDRLRHQHRPDGAYRGRLPAERMENEEMVAADRGPLRQA